MLSNSSDAVPALHDEIVQVLPRAKAGCGHELNMDPGNLLPSAISDPMFGLPPKIFGRSTFNHSNRSGKISSKMIRNTKCTDSFPRVARSFQPETWNPTALQHNQEKIGLETISETKNVTHPLSKHVFSFFSMLLFEAATKTLGFKGLWKVSTASTYVQTPRTNEQISNCKSWWTKCERVSFQRVFADLKFYSVIKFVRPHIFPIVSIRMVKAQQRQAAKVGNSFLVAQHWCHRMISTLLNFTRPYLTFCIAIRCYTWFLCWMHANIHHEPLSTNRTTLPKARKARHLRQPSECKCHTQGAVKFTSRGHEWNERTPRSECSECSDYSFTASSSPPWLSL